MRIDPQLRKDVILGMVVQHYIHTIEPVSSAYIADEYEQDISSATIRNILSELESDGFLTHPHTSAGRVPTERGYRYYVDFIMKEIQLLEEERLRIQKDYEAGMQEFDDLLETTTAIVSELTHCVSVVTLDGMPRAYVCRGTNYLAQQVGAQNIQKMAEILGALEAKERVIELIQRDIDRKTKIYIGQETACNGFEDCAVAVSRFQTRRGPSGRIAVVGPTRMDYQRVVSALEYVSRAIKEMI